MKILLAADGSPFTRIAALHLVSHIEWFAKAPEIHIVHVHPPMPYPSAAAKAGKAAVAKYHREKSEGALAVAEKVPIMIVRTSPRRKPSVRRQKVAGTSQAKPGQQARQEAFRRRSYARRRNPCTAWLIRRGAAT